MDSVAIFTLLLIASAVHAQHKPPLKIVHLGDSYSAGNGARNAHGRRDYNSISGCYRSPSNWGSHFANSLTNSFSVVYINRACSGGDLTDITNERLLNSFEADICPRPTFPEDEIIRREGGRCNRYLRPQVEAVDRATDLVLLTIGGNDGGFADIITRCFLIGFRGPRRCRCEVQKANQNLDGFATSLARTFLQIRAQMRPDARIVLSTYPHIILDVRYILQSFTARFDAGTAIRSLSIRLESIQRDAVARANTAAGVNFVFLFDKTKEVFDGHEAHPVAFRTNPHRWLHEFEGLVIAEWYHPNQRGHEGWGNAISLSADIIPSVRKRSMIRRTVDIAFVVDTGRSMAHKIAKIRTDLQGLLIELREETQASLRFALIKYCNFPQLKGIAGDFTAEIVQTFTSSFSSIQAAIDRLGSSGGRGAMCTERPGMNNAIELPWGSEVSKTAVVLSDDPVLVSDRLGSMVRPSPVNAGVNNFSTPSVRVLGVDVNESSSLVGREIFSGAEGTILNGRANLTKHLLDVIDQNSKLQFATFGAAVSGRVGEPVLFDAQGSFHPSGRPNDLYEWDFNGDGIFDFNTSEAQVETVFSSSFTGYVHLRVTSGGTVSLARAPTIINEEGFVSQGYEPACDLGEDGKPLILTDTGVFNYSCTPINLPQSDDEGIYEITDVTDDQDVIARLQ